MSMFYNVLLPFTVLAYAMVGGVFLAFSDFIMRSLAHTGGIGGVDAMQVINREVFRWIFMALFIGLSPVSILIAVYGGVFVGGAAGTVTMLAGLLYLIGCFGVTVFFNVPMNEALGSMDPGAKATHSYWMQTYLPRWTWWNTVRTVSCALAAVLLMVGLLWQVQGQMHIA